MAVHSLFPAFVRIYYESQFAPHTMTIPTREWIDPSNPADEGSYENWDTTTQEADTMINSLVDLLEPLAPDDVVWTRAEIYTLADEDADPVLKRIIPLTQVGSNAAVAQAEATQHTYTIYDTAGEIFKFVYFDFQVSAWDKISSLAGLSAAQISLVGELTSDANAWSSRAGNQPIAFSQLARKLNDHLRKKYNMN